MSNEARQLQDWRYELLSMKHDKGLENVSIDWVLGRLTALSSPSPQPEQDKRSEIARLLTGRCNNCYYAWPEVIGGNWLTPNFGPFCDACVRELAEPSPSEPPKADPR